MIDTGLNITTNHLCKRGQSFIYEGTLIMHPLDYALLLASLGEITRAFEAVDLEILIQIETAPTPRMDALYLASEYAQVERNLRTIRILQEIRGE